MALGRRDGGSNCARGYGSLCHARRPATAIKRQGHTGALSSESLGRTPADGPIDCGSGAESFEDVMQIEPRRHEGTKRGLAMVQTSLSADTETVATSIVDSTFKVHSALVPRIRDGIRRMVL